MPFLHPDFVPSETSHQLVFSAGRLDRLSEQRSTTCMAQALQNPKTQIIGFVGGRVLIKNTGDTYRSAFSYEELNSLIDGSGANVHGASEADKTDKADEIMIFDHEQAVLLGVDGAVSYLAAPLNLDVDPETGDLLAVVPAEFEILDMRSLARQGLLTPHEYGHIAYGAALLSWHGSHMFCPQCGGKTKNHLAGASRQCTGCEKEHFPRTDPVVIMLIVDQKNQRCLLGRSPHFPTGVYSALAGFVEAGETIESAVRRETFEESGIHVGSVRYHATQPWPFPHSLMIGCYGEALDFDIVKDDHELEDCRWFSKDEIIALLNAEGPKDDEGNPLITMPPSMAIAYHLVSDWARG